MKGGHNAVLGTKRCDDEVLTASRRLLMMMMMMMMGQEYFEGS